MSKSHPAKRPPEHQNSGSGEAGQSRSPAGRTTGNSVPMPPKNDVSGQRRVSKFMYLDWLGGRVLTRQTMHAITEDDGSLEAAHAFIAALKDSVQPRDAVEEMLLIQMAWTHARLGRLTRLAADQTATSNVRIVNESCDRAANTFRRMVQGLADYRRPPQSNSFVAIKQANVAKQQVVQNVEQSAGPSPQKQKPPSANEQGSAPPPPRVPLVADGTGGAPSGGVEKQAVATQHGTHDAGGQGTIAD